MNSSYLARQKMPPIRDFYAGQIFPTQQVNACRSTEAYFPTRAIRAGDKVRDLGHSKASLEGLIFDDRGQTLDLYDYVSQNRIAGLLVLKNNELVLENYEFGNHIHTRWMSMSMAKSVSTTLVGAAIQDGYITSVDDLLVKYLPELDGGSYAAVSIRQLMQMSSGVTWNEDHTDPSSQRREVLELQIAQEPGGITKYMSQLPRVADPGACWNYSTGETHLVGELLRAATGQWLSDYLSDKIWQPAGMEHHAAWWLESDEGLEVAGSGICATLRDYGRFGLFVQNGGQVDGAQVLPDNWITDAAGPARIGGETVPYGYMWWSDMEHPAAFTARGIFGQRIHVDPEQNLVVVILAARSKPIGVEGAVDLSFIRAVTSALAD